MSNISTVFDAFLDKLEALFPNHLRLSDPYNLEKNTEREYRKGYGLKVLAGENTYRQVSCMPIFIQDFGVVFSRLMIAHDLERDRKDTVEKYLLEDLYTLVKALETDQKLNTTIIIGNQFLGHEGISFAKGERDDIVLLQSNYRITFGDDLN